MKQNRRDFLKTAAGAAGSVILGGCAVKMRDDAPPLAGNMAWGVLQHLGSNMWGDWTYDKSKIPSSEEELKRIYPDDKVGNRGLMPVRVCNYLRADEKVWRDSTSQMQREGMNLVMIDLGEAFAFPSRPELWVNGSWSADKLRGELVRLRNMGMEPVPKLNFSTGHDQWLKHYHYLTSTKRYYEVVADVIADVAEVFDHPRYFHIGFDEEIPVALRGRKMMAIRQGDLWWHDLYYVISHVEKHGSRAMMWSDKICGGREEFLKRMTKGALQVPWYYGRDFSEKILKWRPELEKKLDSWESQGNLASAIVELDRAGFDMMPCSSNWADDRAADAMLSFIKNNVNPNHVKGFLMAPWAKLYKEDEPKLAAGIRIFAEAKRKYYA